MEAGVCPCHVGVFAWMESSYWIPPCSLSKAWPSIGCDGSTGGGTRDEDDRYLEFAELLEVSRKLLCTKLRDQIPTSQVLVISWPGEGYWTNTFWACTVGVSVFTEHTRCVFTWLSLCMCPCRYRRWRSAPTQSLMQCLVLSTWYNSEPRKSTMVSGVTGVHLSKPAAGWGQQVSTHAHMHTVIHEEINVSN